MKMKKIDSETFNSIKQASQYMTVNDVADAYGVGTTSVVKIKRCDDYAEFEELNRELAQKQRDSAYGKIDLYNMSDEERFWKIHTDLRTIPNKAIREKSGLPIDEIALIKLAEDYETYKRIKTGKVRRPRGKGNKIRRCCNEGVIQVIRKGREAGYSSCKMSKYLDVSDTSISRYMRGVENDKFVTEAQYNVYKEHLGRAPARLRRSIRESKNFIEWSLKFYLNKTVNQIPWLQEDSQENRKNVIQEDILEKKQDYLHNPLVFRMIKTGQEYGYSIYDIEKNISDREFIEQTFELKKWHEFRERYNYSEETPRVIDKALFDSVRKCLENNLDPKEFIYEAEKYASEIVEMSKYSDFDSYITGIYFNGLNPIWLEKPKENKIEEVVEKMEKAKEEVEEKVEEHSCQWKDLEEDSRALYKAKIGVYKEMRRFLIIIEILAVVSVVTVLGLVVANNI